MTTRVRWHRPVLEKHVASVQRRPPPAARIGVYQVSAGGRVWGFRTDVSPAAQGRKWSYGRGAGLIPVATQCCEKTRMNSPRVSHWKSDRKNSELADFVFGFRARGRERRPGEGEMGPRGCATVDSPSPQGSA